MEQMGTSHFTLSSSAGCKDTESCLAPSGAVHRTPHRQRWSSLTDLSATNPFTEDVGFFFPLKLAEMHGDLILKTKL